MSNLNTVGEWIEYLKTQPEDAMVKISFAPNVAVIPVTPPEAPENSTDGEQAVANEQGD